MVKYFYSIKDELVGFNDPLLMVNDDVAIRTFIASVNQIDDLKNNAKDYSLYLLGDFDSDSGKISRLQYPKKLLDAISALRKENE